MKSIVVIDPSATFVKYVSRVIARLGYEVLDASDIEAGLAIIDRHKPDLVLSEIIIPKGSVFELCRRMHNELKLSRIPVVIVTTDGTVESMEQAKKVGCVDYLAKPLAVRDIHLMLQRNLPFAIKRRVIRLNVTVDAVIHSGEYRVEAKTITLGEGGMLIRSDSEIFRNGSVLDISLFLSSDSSPVHVSGKVIYDVEPAAPNTSRGIGIKFIHVSPDAAEHLIRFIEEAI